ncbi:Rne/Rng family ribonuclease [Branchiibius sp. NY16-3462-2]|uniref:Rne/Rng family ribonuclease n=1 Tax=Branchiibius sp. NY16-3462-2 TaxID=1807500 RepID=UPI00079A554F|nr:Rne/Rng family ribonuclease [Branchiibius sp. NY16-3462-2]KYH43815.1 ribonuclease [Branchiibius sp. NY16-3462-2]
MGPFDAEHPDQSDEQVVDSPEAETAAAEPGTDAPEAEAAEPDVVEPDVVLAELLPEPEDAVVDEIVIEVEEIQIATVEVEPVTSPFSHDEEPEAAVPPVVAHTGAAFGLLFQAPDPASVPPRPEPQEAEPEPVSDAPQAQDESDRPAETEDTQEASTPRRRRGGRGRRSRAKDAEAEANEQGDQTERTGKNADKSDKSTDKADGGPSGDESPEAAEESGDESGSSRRRTRRRRRGNASGVDEDGVKVRAARDEVTSIKGSTRLEAKKQRRREGRENSRRRTVITEAEFLARRESVERVMVVREKDGITQIGVIEDNVLVEHYVSRETQQATMAGNVYLGRIQNVLPSMEAAFVDIGRGRNGVLYAGEVNWDAAGLDGQPKRIEHALKSGETVLVQVTKDPLGHKGARLTSQVSLPGRFLVYVPGNSMTGISRKLPDVERARLKKILREIVPEDAGVIVRTAAEGASEEDLRADVERLKSEWEHIQHKAKTASAPAVLHGEPDMTIRVVRDVFNEDFAKLIVAGDTEWDRISGYLNDVAPELAQRAQKWTGEVDLFTTYRVDEQLAKALDRKVWLPSGGSLVIDRTEAMTVVDVNTGKFVGSGGNLEETVTKNNIEAAEEIVRQLRLRDIGGIIVVDFIDMVLESNRDLVVRRLLECLGRDRTKHQVAEVTSLGLVQMTRKRVGTGLLEIFSENCEHCGGRGVIIRDTPADKPNTANGGGMSNGSRSQRKGRGSDGPKKNRQEQDTEPAKPNGPSAAQIAAAAHAAAAKKTGDSPADGPEQDVAQDVAVEAPVIDAPQHQDPGAVTPEAASTPAEPIVVPEPVHASQPAPVTRRKKRPRVVAPAGPPSGAATVSTVDDLAAPATHQ